MAEKVAATAKAKETKQTRSNSSKQNADFNSSVSPAERILQLQRTAGNQAVQRLIKSGALQNKPKISQPNDQSTHGKVKEEEVPVPASEEMSAVRETPPTKTEEEAATLDPRKAIAPAISVIQHRAASERRHPPASVPVAAAQAAGIDPKTEQTRTAAEQTVKNLDADAAEAKNVKREEFKSKLKKAIEEATRQPKTESEADKVMKTGAANASKVLSGQLATERDAAIGPLKSTVATEVPPTTQPAPPQTKLRPEQVGSPPAPVSAASVVPAPRPPLDYSSDRAPTDQIMAENNITQEQLVEGNDPAFGSTLQARSIAEKNEATVEARYRQSESKVRDHAQGEAQQALTQGLTGLHSVRELKINKVVEHQLGTKSKSLDERQKITDKVNSIKDKTRKDVKAILDEMENEATKIFEDGLKSAEEAYEKTFEEATGGVGTWLTTWGSDWEELIEKSLAKARKEYLIQVDKAIDKVADFVETKLKAAKQRVADGRKEVDDFVKGLDDSVKQFGEEALQAVSTEFDAMATDIDQRRDSLIDKMSQQYKASYERMSAMEEKFREENKSLWQRVYDATVGVIKKIIEFKNMLLGVLGRAVEVIGDIIAHPVRFLGNLVSGVMQGLKNFMGKIGIYLQKGLMDWLFGALAGTGLQMPDKFDLKGIISIVLQILGLTYANFRARAVAIVGEPVVAALEKAAEVFKIFITEGIPGLWRFIKDKLTDLKSMVLDAIFDFVQNRVIMAGITWIIGLLNPASAFFKACKAIYDIVMFFINRGSQIMALVNAVVDSMGAIAKGAIGTAASFVEGALAKAIPVAIGFLASLLGLGDPAKPVRELIEKARAPIDKAIDWVINLAVKGVKAVGKFVGGLFGKKDKDKKDVDGKDQQDIYSLTKERLMDRLGYKASVAQGQVAATKVLNELKALGLRTLSLRWSEKARSYVFDAEASPGKEVIWLAPSNKHVLMYAKVTMVSSPLEGIEERFFAESSESLKITGGRRISRPSPPKEPPGLSAQDPRGHRKQSLALVEPSQGASSFEVVSWNAGGPVKDSVVSHAEYQFVEWMTSRQRDASWRARVKEVDIHISHSPCDDCASQLYFLATMLPNAGKLQIRWDELYVDPKGKRSTSAKGFDLLKTKWKLIPPTLTRKDESSDNMDVKSKQ